ncbi:sulfatase-like hydrolase/transferase [Methanococcoides alaskense]|uniref:Bisphosphoglycerate-independent phosphoglycerate mutase (AlkP superfamily) n=1 Tax=Methanococcoides alaskense TaxID=325778 RepID=A0AA90U008_9EURY|nr:sulfatase-like hydrolase/transferase [Methanococcoides alaskense]MDA0525744.1 sulfatase-like hydrolase/transferase [Methanococcoides alaskense]MDR6222970.1 bisphosphoglycerate-independent phosphoglycerate mutase (AlkP superfamily) [Methanococcoides alaskense]
MQLSTPVVALTPINIQNIETDHGAVILIVDGLGANYINPEKIPYALDGSPLEKPNIQNISALAKDGLQAFSVLTPSTKGENGHSVIVTGNPRATSAMIAHNDATVYDVARDNGYLMFAILEKGDTTELLAEQDVAIYDSTTSINDPQMKVLLNDHTSQHDTDMIIDVEKIFKEYAILAPTYVQQYKEGEIERYNAYNLWGIETALKVIELMEQYPDQKYILTINIGAIDIAGLYRRNEGYVECIEELDIMVQPLIERTEDNDLAFILTSDHGMAFQSVDGCGGSKSDKYATSPEVLQIPFIATSSNIERNFIEETLGQEDIAPTILSILDLPNELRFSAGEPFATKKYVNFKVLLPETGSVRISSEQAILESEGDSEYIIYGLEKEKEYTINAELSGNGNQLYERTVFADSDKIIRFDADNKPDKNKDMIPKGMRKIIGSTLIIGINLTGLAMIFRVVKS